MTNRSNMKTLKISTFLLFLVLLSCSKEELGKDVYTNNPSTFNTNSNDSDCVEEFTLYAGQNIDVGTVSVSNDSDSIYVTYTTTGGWLIYETHVYVGDVAGIPTNNSGNPQIGLFPHNMTHSGVSSFTVAFAIDENLDCYAIAAHAVVGITNPDGTVQTETAWSNGNDINDGGSWATYSEYCLQDCCEYEEVVYEYYGGQNILTGNLTVTNDDQNLYVTFNFSGGWVAGQTHLYVGDASGIPVNGANTPIPGQFPYSVSHNPAVDSYTYIIPLSDLNDNCIAIAAHAELLLFDEDGNLIQEETGWSFGTEFPNTNRWGWFSEYCIQICE